ncbi:protease SohB [Exilibacterium tricleocarpae]|uniref:Protease SohB n=1 Tax=Exilibacterium tricleocarpae TaxID=2591008 RepID=A0A545TVR3_9GAMM|nr:protease SohB [Exilibacterium tricleocarpae]TQV81292.1 protease SohB [Exilibacterium tricleocarpae]
MEFLAEYGMFLAKAVTVVVAVGVIVALIVAAGQRGQRKEKGHIEVSKINDNYASMRDALKAAVLPPEQLKTEEKAEKKRLKKEKADTKKALKETPQDQAAPHKKRMFVLSFHGDIKASATASLREEISTVLSLAGADDEVVVRLESGGGLVHSYGLASSQLARITKNNIPLTVCVDKVAASGGYMMACVADRILAAPFAVIGSIGVVAQLPNFHRLLKKNAIDFEMLTAGEYKRTLTVFGENTDKGREKFIEDLEDTHDLFKTFVSEHRAQVDIAEVATGEVWFGQRALERKLVDELQTSDEYITAQLEDADIYEVAFVHKKSLPEKLGLAAQQSVDRLLLAWWDRLQSTRFFS